MFYDIYQHNSEWRVSCLYLSIETKIRFIFMSLHMPIRGIRSFCVAARCLSFKHAASQLYITPSAVSHQMKQLEEQLNLVLFKRKTRSIELTTAGKKFYESVKPIVEQLDLTIAQHTNIKQNKTIVISLPEFFASELLVPRLAEWSEQNPEINLKLETVKPGTTPSQSTDLSIVLSHGKPNASIIHQLFPLSYAPACAFNLYDKLRKIGFEALNNTPLILHSARPWSWHQWADKSNIQNFDPKQIIQFDSMFGVARAAQQGLGIALIPLPISQAWFNEKLLFRLFDQDLITNDHYYLVQHEKIGNRKELNLFASWVNTSFSLK